MKHYVAYHNPDTMGYDAADVDEDADVVTGKSVRDVIGSRVWLIAGRGRPRRFSLVGTFVAEHTGASPDDPSLNLVGGTTDRTSFRPEITLDHFGWFSAFNHTMGNFGLGFQRISDPRFIDAHGASSRRPCTWRHADRSPSLALPPDRGPARIGPDDRAAAAHQLTRRQRWRTRVGSF